MNQAENGGEEREESGPSVQSENPEERIAARRLRIAARIEAKKRILREALGDSSHEKKDKEEMRKSQKQVEQSCKRMIKLQADGTELVTNIQVAGDWKESQRRTEEEEARRQRTEKLESEAKTSLEKFEEITKKWTSARMKEIPQDLREALNMQQQQCALLIEEKNKLITDLQQELKASDDRYVKDLKKQAEDIDLMIERMEEQIKNLIKSYREELDQIEKAFELERRELLDNNRKKWEQMMQSRRDKELEYLILRMKRVEEHEKQLQQLRVEDAEEYNMIKIKLETDVQILEQQLQQMKATYQLNQEKLEYNFQVLKKRDEENTITKSQQKRKITSLLRLQDVLNNLRIKCAKQEKQSREENHSLTDDYKRIMQQYKEMQKKIRHFAAIDAKTFEDIWLMNEAEVKELVEKALQTDRLIHEQQLGVAWVRPPLPFMEHLGPIIPQRKLKKSAGQLAGELLSQDQDVTDTEHPVSTAEDHMKISAKTVKRLLEILCDETGFLIESKLLKLLSPLEKDEQSLMKLDAIFLALGIENEEDVYKLADFFMTYKQQQKEDEDEDVGCIMSTVLSEIFYCTFLQFLNCLSKRNSLNTFLKFSEKPWEMSQEQRRSRVLEREDSSSVPHSSSLDPIHPNDVLKALQAFTTEYCRPRSKTQPQCQSNVLNLEERDDSEDRAYWESMANVIPESKLKIWDALETALEKYYNVLTERAKLIDETDGLKQQNAELRMLLHQYVNSRVNAELEIPPTQVMQLEPAWN
uniref:Dynein regulatory complex protein 1 n=1 Tax=Lepisosteus oculatus TaxID=7918 RepID=W5NH33_LEPOC